MTPSSTSVLAETLQKSGGRLIGRQARGGKVGTGMQSSAKKGICSSPFHRCEAKIHIL